MKKDDQMKNKKVIKEKLNRITSGPAELAICVGRICSLIPKVLFF
jgi:hypothetical protein